MVRIGAAVTVVVLAILLGLTAVSSFAPSDIVVPTGGVTDAGPQDDLPSGEEAQDALAERSRLQNYRGESGPSPDGRVSDPALGQDVPAGEREATGGELVDRWRGSEQKDWQLLRERGFVEGISPTIPDPRADVLEQPQGREWRRLHNEEVTFGGGWVIFGFSLLLALFLLLRGRIPLESGFSGIKVPRFDAFERANHWFTASSFVMLALTGLILLYGQFFLKSWMGAGAYSWLAQASVYVHVAFTVTFTIGLLVMIAIWTGRNLPKRIDLEWLKRGGGFFSDKGGHPPAEKFNAGQKLIFWAVFLGGGLLVLSGVSLLFPFFWFGIGGMQWTMIFHAGVGLVMIAIIIGHIYIGTVGMVGAIDAMWSGEVDRNWAEEHHDLWVKNEIDRGDERRGAEQPRPHPHPNPAE